VSELYKLTLPILVVFGVAALLLYLLKSGRKASGVIYTKIDRLFTKAERSFFGVLTQAVGNRFCIMGKVRVADVIKPASGQDRSAWQTAFNRIASKHLDFVACDPADLTVKFAIELDDSSHHRRERTARDTFLNDAMKSAGVPLYRFNAKRTYSVSDIRKTLEPENPKSEVQQPKTEQVHDNPPPYIQASVNFDALTKGLQKYLRIQEMYWQTDVATSREFQKAFNGFYRVRRNAEWQKPFYELLQRIKTEEMDFAHVLKSIYESTGNVEASFCSKLIATRHPHQPVIDQFVMDNLGLSLPKASDKDRLDKIVSVYEKLTEQYGRMLKDPEYLIEIAQLRKLYPETETISDVKALDLILWQTR